MPTARFTATIAAALLIACGDPDPDVPPTDALQTTDISFDQLTEQQIQQLTAQYPRLGEEPLPEPTPSPDASPSDIPDRVRAVADERVLRSVNGEASYYANQFEGRRTASGIPFRQNQMVAAHRAYPFGTILRVTNTGNGRSVNVRVVDRGPFGSERRIVDLSRRAAQELGFISAGHAQVRVEVLEWGRGIGSA